MQDGVVADLRVARGEAPGLGLRGAIAVVVTLRQQHAKLRLAAHAALHMAEIGRVFGDADGTVGGAACEGEKREQRNERLQRIARLARSVEKREQGR